ncbi:Leucine-rich repeat-containing protein [Desulfonema limicola]|uniref:Leucine-rich repeat-containing protein n=2 Tax=Desulfonema limicola TaxID=45656 RepID=A0A975B6Y3_9BACT|nr:Leucine-rich repeat-containing protein [Desulfonema limicola]
MYLILLLFIIISIVSFVMYINIMSGAYDESWIKVEKYLKIFLVKCHMSNKLSLSYADRHLPTVLKLTKLNTLFMNAVEMDILPLEICEFNKLRHLGLTLCSIQKLPKEIGKLNSLQSLVLTSNSLVYLPIELGDLFYLKELNLSYNQIVSLPPEICKLKNLEILNLECNQIIKLPKEIGKLESLKTLSLKDNILSEIPKEIFNLPNIEVLNIGGNNITIDDIKNYEINGISIIIEYSNISEVNDSRIGGSVKFKRNKSDQYFIVKENRHNVTIYERKTGSFVIKYNNGSYYYDRIDEFCISPDDKHLVIIENDCEEYPGQGTLSIYDIQTKERKKFENTLLCALSDITFSEDGRYVKTKQFSRSDTIWDYQTGKIVICG